MTYADFSQKVIQRLIARARKLGARRGGKSIDVLNKAASNPSLKLNQSQKRKVMKSKRRKHY